jgi:hypothetical protein
VDRFQARLLQARPPSLLRKLLRPCFQFSRCALFRIFTVSFEYDVCLELLWIAFKHRRLGFCKSLTSRFHFRAARRAPFLHAHPSFRFEYDVCLEFPRFKNE